MYFTWQAILTAVIALTNEYRSVIFWLTLYWQNYEELPVLLMTARFVPLSVAGVSVNVVMATLVAYVVSGFSQLGGTAHGVDADLLPCTAGTDNSARRNNCIGFLCTLDGYQ